MQRWPSFYCERAMLPWLEQPVNTLSNAAFFVAAFLALRLWREAGGRDRKALALIGIVFAIGIGSTAFHAVPSRLTLLMDVVPIQIFMLAYLALALSRFGGLSMPLVALGLAAFVAVVAAAQFGLPQVLPRGPLRQALGYAIALLALVAVGGGLLASARGAAAPAAMAQAGRALLLAGAVFAASLTLRQIDQPFCPSIPFGTHWLWHVLNGVVLFILLRAAIGHGGGAPQASRAG